MKTTVSSRIDKILFVLFFILYVMFVVITSAVLTGCASDEIAQGPTSQEVSAIGNQQDAKLSNGIGEIQASVIDSSETVGETDSNGEDSSDSDVENDIGADSEETDSEDANSEDEGKVKNMNGDAIIATGGSDSMSSADDVKSKSEETSSANVIDTVGTDSGVEVIQDTGSVSIQDVGNSKQPDIITITKDIISTVKDVVTDIIADTSAEVFIDMVTETASQKPEVSGKLDIGGVVDVESKTMLDAKTVTDTKTTIDVATVKDSQVTKDIQVVKDAFTKDVQAQDSQTQDTKILSPADITQLNDGTTWYTSKAYQYKVQFPSWVEASQLKTTDLLLSGNSANKIGLTNQQLATTAHFTLRTEFEYCPSYVGFDDWWKYLYGKPDEVATYQGQTLKYHSADSGGGFNRYTYVKIGKVGALRIEMSFSMPEHLFVDGFMEKSLEVLYMVTKSAQAVN